MTRAMAALCGFLALGTAAPALAGGVKGDYIEARTADIYTGPCFSNAEVLITGHQAVAAWKVTEGSFDGVKLDGLSVAAAIRGTTTFSQDCPEKARAVLIVDERADATQRAALIGMAKALGGARLENVVAVKVAPISLTVEEHTAGMHDDGVHALHGMPQAARGAFWAPGLAEIATRPLDDGDHFCGNETVAYPPLSKGVTAQPAYTLGHRFRDGALGTTWDDPNCRSSFVGHFTLAEGELALAACK